MPSSLFAIAGLLMLVLPRRWGVLAIVLAACTGAARVYLRAHNPLDVVGGAGSAWRSPPCWREDRAT
jgi:membrane-associated phospholipid phosphatase